MLPPFCRAARAKGFHFRDSDSTFISPRCFTAVNLPPMVPPVLTVSANRMGIRDNNSDQCYIIGMNRKAVPLRCKPAA